MKGMFGFSRFFRLTAFRPAPDEDLEAELSFHFEETERELMESGFSRREARAEAIRRFGDLGSYRRKLGEMERKRVARARRTQVLANLRWDLACAFRGMRRSPGFSAAVILILGLGIGANAAIFGVIDRLLFTPPAHVRNPGEVTRLQVHRVSPFTGQPATMAYQTYLDYQDFLPAAGFNRLAAFGDMEVVLGRGEEAERVNALMATASFFPLLGVSPALGRFFNEAESGPGAPGVAVLSQGLWQRRFGSDPGVLGRTLSMGDGTFTIIGVAPPQFNGIDLEPVDVFVPLHTFTVFQGSDRWTQHRGYYWLQVVGRLASGTSRQAAEEEATTLHRNGRRGYIEEGRYSEDARIVLGSVKAALGPDAPNEVRVSRWLLGVTVIVLLIACANVANLLLARGSRRRRELGIRVALGISSARLLGQHLLESVLLAVLGGLVGLALAYAGGHLLRSVFLPQIAWFGSPVDSRVLAFTMTLATVTGLLAGLAPALRGSGSRVVESLRAGDRGASARRSRSQTLLLLAQASLSVILLTGAGLFLRSLKEAQDLDLGLNPEDLVVAQLDLAEQLEPEENLALWKRAVDRIGQLHGVERASVGSGIPFQGMMAFDLFAEGVDSLPVPRGMGPFVTIGSAGHVAALGVQLRAGRMYTEGEAARGDRVAVVTRNMARGIWGEEEALGRCLMLNERDSPCWRVVGIVQDHHLSRVVGDVPWQYYLPFGRPALEAGSSPGAIFARTHGDPSALLGPVRRELQEMDPRIRFAFVRLQKDLVDPQLRSWRLGATMFSLFGALALIVAATGLYSVLAFNVSRRTRELGIRTAVGASGGSLVALVVREAMGVMAFGVALGILLSLLAGPRLGPLLFQTSPRDPAILATVAATLLLVAGVASALPAWRAARVDPMSALRVD